MVFLCGHSVVSFRGIQVKSTQNIACSTIDIDMYRMLYPVYNIQIFVNTVHYCFLLPHLNKPTHSIIYHPVPPTGTHHVPKCHLSRKRRRQPRRLKSNEAPRINQKKNGKLGRWELVCEETCERKLDVISKAWKVGVSSFPFFLGGKMAENGSIDPLEPILGILIVGDLNFTWLFLDVGQQNCGKGGEHIRIFRYTHIHTSDFSRSVRTNCLTLDLRGKSTPRREWWNPGNPFLHHFRVYLKILETLESCSLRP